MKRILDNIVLLEPYLIGLLPVAVVLVMLLLAGCTTAGTASAGRTRDLATTAVTTAGGAYIGAKEGDGKAGSAALGAAVGFVAGEAVNHFNNKSQRAAFISGYEKGQSDAVKQQYWIARDNQRPKSDDGYEESYYEIPVPPSDRGGVHREPTTRVIRVVLPKEGQ
jgi:hypothetical protein